ncbi:hypothetical protein GGH95_002817 [Coemansia sp. RSA 1836]|nr:hypothetical protein GGH95_002817 [Coemansia sp. RSA 1836]
MLDRVLPLDVLGQIFVLAQWPSLARVSRAFHAASQAAGVRARYCLAEFGRARVLDGALGLPARRPRMTRPDVVLLLLRLGADPRADDQWVLRHACATAGPWMPVVRALLRAHDYRAHSDLDDSAEGAYRGPAANAHADTVRALLARGADARAEHSRALRAAVLCGDANADAVAALLDAGACVHAVGDSCLLAAAYAGDGAAPAPGPPPPEWSRAALLAYAAAGLPTLPPIASIASAAAQAAPPRRYADPRRSAPPPATHVRLMRLLLERGAAPDACEGRPLAYACARGSARTAAVLLAYGADPRARDDEPLRDAAERGHADVLRLLLRAGASVHAAGGNALANAARGGHAAAVRLLLAHGADVRGTPGSRALSAAARGGWAALVRELVALGAGSNHADNHTDRRV